MAVLFGLAHGLADLYWRSSLKSISLLLARLNLGEVISLFLGKIMELLRLTCKTSEGLPRSTEHAFSDKRLTELH